MSTVPSTTCGQARLVAEIKPAGPFWEACEENALEPRPAGA